MTDWIQASLKKHGPVQAFDEVFKPFPPYPGFFVPKKAYREVAQGEGKEMSNMALDFGGSRGGTGSPTKFTSDTLETCSLMRQSTCRLQYDGTIAQPHV